MRSYLNYGNSADYHILEWIRSLGFDGVRADIRMSHEWGQVREFLDVLKRVDFSPLFLLPFEEDKYYPLEMLEWTEQVAAMLRDWGFDRTDVALEWCNEPNIFSNQWREDPELLGDLFVRAIPRIRTHCKNIKILTPSVSNLDKNTQAYARKLFAPITGKASDYHIAFHRYPDKGHKPHAGYESRQHEWLSFLEIVHDGNDNREYWCTETGYSQNTFRSLGFPLCFLEKPHKRSQEEQAEFCAIEYDIWHLDTNVEAVTWYNLNDGPTDEVIDGYGIRDITWKPKVIANRFFEIHDTLRRDR